jgi:hypothetical protein
MSLFLSGMMDEFVRVVLFGRCSSSVYIPNQRFNPNHWGQWLVVSFTNIFYIGIFQPDAID